jgi:hypothetical protein
MKYRGSCHCGKVAYEVEVEGGIQGVMSCNCSMCGRRGSLLTFTPRNQFKLLSGEPDLTTYTFNRHAIQHRFCKHCGVQSFAWGTDPKGNEMAAINVRCLEDFEFEKLPVQHVNGKAF